MEKLLIGPGEFYSDGWLNLDYCSDVKCDVVGSILNLPFLDAVFDRIYLGHVLEHIPLEDVPTALTEVKRVLKSEGRVGVVGPDINKGQKMVDEGTQPPSLLHDIEFGEIDGTEIIIIGFAMNSPYSLFYRMKASTSNFVHLKNSIRNTLFLLS